tara:strand:+ start:3098 stop:3874 length:777 start_codon:yes stop_codon:yes gene_type:complete
MITISCGHNAGFFSCCNAMLDRIISYSRNKTFLENDIIFDSKKQYKFYNPFPDTDIRPYFFKTDLTYQCDSKIRCSSAIDKTKNVYEKIGNYKSFHHLVRKYFCLSDNLEKMRKDILSEYKIDVNNTCAIYYRSTDKVGEVKIPKPEKYIKKALEIKQENPNIKFLLQSDSHSFLKQFKSHFSEEDIIMIHEDVKKSERPIHRDSQISKEESFHIVQKFVVIVKILSECQHFVFDSSNVSLFCVFWRGNRDNLHQIFA